MAIYYEEYGSKEGPLIIFLHGGGVGGWMWDQQVSYFQEYNCIIPDLPEHGRSKNGETFSIRSSAQKVIQIIDTIGKGKQVIVIGFSLGAQIVIQILSMRPYLIDFAMINSALVKPMQIGKELLEPLIRLSFPLVKWKPFSRLQANVIYIHEDDFEKYYDEVCQMDRQTLIRILDENMSFEIPGTFRKARSNILVTVGEKENMLMKKSAKEISRSNPNCQGILIAEVGHGFPLAKPELFNKMMKDWIEGRRLTKESTPL